MPGTYWAEGPAGEDFNGSSFTWANSCPYIVAVTTSSLIRSVHPSIAASQSAGVTPTAAVTRATRAGSSVAQPIAAAAVAYAGKRVRRSGRAAGRPGTAAVG